jgi:2-phosphosulfolactate phosphatase
VNLGVSFLPRDLREPERKACLVVDVLRATSTLVAILAAGCRDVVLEGTVGAARAAARGSGRLLCGEEDGLRPADFDHGNSPGELAALDLRDRAVTFVTTNGTKALRAASGAPLVLAASLLNGPAAAALALREAEDRGLDLEIVCAGRRGGTAIALDDAFCAGYLTELLAQRGSFAIRSAASPLSTPAAAPMAEARRIRDSALVALRLFGSYRAQRASVEAAALAAFADSTSGRTLTRLGLGDDIAFCARPAVSPLVPRVVVDGADEGIVRVILAT